MTPLETNEAILVEKKQLTKDVYQLFFYTEKILVFEPGQYVVVHVPDGKGGFVKRLYSIASQNTQENRFELLIKCFPDGVASSFIRSTPLFTVLQIAGPAGVFRVRETPNPKVFMVTGSGFAPIRSFLLSSKKTSSELLLLGVQTLDDVFMIDELLLYKKTRVSFHFVFCLSRETDLNGVPARFLNHFHLGRIDSVWGRLVSEYNNGLNEYYLCGSRTVVESLRLFLLSTGSPTGSVYFEKY